MLLTKVVTHASVMKIITSGSSPDPRKDPMGLLQNLGESKMFSTNYQLTFNISYLPTINILLPAKMLKLLVVRFTFTEDVMFCITV